MAHADRRRPVAAAFDGRNAAGWSAIPLFVNDTVYLGTPLSRILALEPDTGKVKWTYDAKPNRTATPQRDLTNRGVAYWQAATISAGEPCQKRVYVGTVDGEAPCRRRRHRKALRRFR